MSTSTIMLEHAAHPEWNAPNEFSAETYAELHERFDDTPVSVLDIARVLVQATDNLEEVRHNNEILNFSKLLPVLSDKEERLYHQLSGSRENVGQYLAFFGKVASRMLQHRIQSQRIAKVTLQLGGKRQFGDWECTHGVDEFARSIPGILRRDYPGVTVDDKLDEPNRYRLDHIQLESETDSADYPELRRRKPVANITFPDLPAEMNIEIFKESRALWVRKLSGELIRSGIANGLSETEAVGAGFEEAIGAPKGSTRDFVVVTADYFVTMRNPLFFPAVPTLTE